MANPILGEVASDALEHLRKNWGWILLWGILLLITGIIAISYSVATTLLSIIFLGVMLVIGGILVIFDAFKYWWRQWGGFILHLLLGILYLALGIMLMRRPLLGALSVTLLLGIFFIAIGIVKVVESLANRLPMWGWLLFSGIVSLLLGILILVHWPTSSLYIIGLFIGIDLIFAGWAEIMAALAVRHLPPKVTPTVPTTPV